MAEVIEKLINIKTNEAINNVKELKQYISELTDDLVKVEKGSKEYEETLEEIGRAQKKLTEVQRDSKNALDAETGSYRALNKELVALRNEYKSYSEAQRNSAEIGGKTLARIQELDAELKSIDATMGNYQRNVGHYQLALEALNKTYASQRQELKALKVAMETLEPGTEEYAKAFNRAAEITHNLAEQQEMLRYSSADLGDQLSNMRGIATNMIAGFSAVNAAMGLFGEQNDDVQKAMLRVQQAMAIVQGLQGMDGLIKRTKGLSTAMKVWFTTSKQVTTQTVAQTAALNGETVATEGATVAQKGFNAAMKANPIGVVVMAVMAIVTAYTLFKSKIDKLIQGSEKLQGILGKVRGALSAMGTTLKNAVLVPIQELVNYVTTLGKIMYDVFTGNWDKIGEDFKAGIDNAKDIVINAGKEIAESYNKGIQNVNEEYARKRAEARAKELQEIIDTNEAKYGADWKYTQSGKTLYEEYLDMKINSYKKDSEEYKQAVNDKLAYEREYNEKQEKAEKEKQEKIKQAQQTAQREREQLENNYISNIQRKYGTSIRETVNTYKSELSTLSKYLSDQIKNSVEPTKTELKNLLKEIDNEIKRVKGIDIFGLENSSQPLKNSFELMKKLFSQNIDTITKIGGEEAQRKVNDEIVKLYEKTLIPDINKENSKLQAALEENLAKINFDILFGGGESKEKEKAELVYQSTMQQLTNMQSHYQKIVDFVDDNGLIPSDVYDEAKLTLVKIGTAIEEAGADYEKTLSEINSKFFKLDIAKIESETDKAIKDIQNHITEQTTQRTFWDDFFNVPPSFQETLELTNMMFDTEIDGLERVKEKWRERMEDESLTYEERLEAKQNFVTVSSELDDTLLEKEKANADARTELIQKWVSAVDNAATQIGSLFGAIADYYKDDIDAKIEHNQLTREQGKEEYEKTVKPLMIAQATIQMLQGMVSAFAGAMQLGPIAGPIVGGVLAAAVGAMGAINIAKIKSTNPYSNGGGTPSASVPTADYDFNPQYVTNTTGQEDTQNLRNALTEQPIKAYVVESAISNSQDLARKRSSESNF